MFLNWGRDSMHPNSGKRGATGRARAGRARPSFRPQIEALEDRSLMTVTIMQNFANINFQDSGGFTPPDTMMAVGPSAVLGAVNTAITLKTKTGSVLAPPEQFSQFFSSIFNTGDTFSDPFVVFDDQAGRFYICVLEIPPNNDNGAVIDFAVSRSSTPTDLSSANWTVFPQITSVNQGGTALADFPKMGFSSDAVFISTNQFAGNTFTGNLILAISKQSILSGGPLATQQKEFTTNADTRIMIPARMHNGPPNTEFFVQKDDEATSTVNVIDMSDYLTGAFTTATTTIKVNAFQQSPGIRDLTDQVDDRILSVDWVNNQMVAAGNVGLSDGLNHARWYVFTTAGTPALVQQGDIVNPGFDSSYPSISLSPTGQIGMSFIQSASVDSTTDFPSMFVTGRLPSDPLNVMEPPVLVIAGKGHLGGPPPPNRGGDYSATEFDPSNPAVVWSSNQYAFDDSGNNFHWGTQIASFSLSAAGFSSRLKAFHPFRYVVHAPPAADAGAFSGNITVINLTQTSLTGQFFIILGPLPTGVTLDPSVPTITLSTGQLAIPLPVSGLPAGETIRVKVAFRNPLRVPISTFFEGFTVTLAAN
jgi:hypothetical protein